MKSNDDIINVQDTAVSWGGGAIVGFLGVFLDFLKKSLKFNFSIFLV